MTAAATTITAAQIIVGIFTVALTVATSLTLPTGTLINADILGGTTDLPVNQSIDWAVINLGSALGAVSVVDGTSHTVVGSRVIAIGTTASFRTRLSAANTAVTYRIT